MLRARLLGGLGLERDGRALPLPERAGARSLLAWLALHPGRHARSTVAGALWPDVREDSARVSLRSALAALRPALGRDAAALAATRGDVELADEVWVDIREFARLADGDPGAALALCRGPLLPGLADDWVLSARDAQRAREGELLARLADAAAAPEEAVALARRRAELDPFDEPAQRDLMRRLAAIGDRAGALAGYERLTGRLRRELGVPPSSATRAVAAELRAGAPAAKASPVAPALPVRLAAARRRSPLAGRERELARLRALWTAARAGRTAGLVTGEPGIGKTRLLAELASTLHADGAVVLYGRAEEDALSPYGAIATSLPELAARVSRAAAGEPVAPARLFEAVAVALDAAAAGRPLVLLLDDLHWADAATTRLVAHLGACSGGAPRLLVLAYRDVDPAHPLLAALTALRRDLPVEHVALSGLDRAGVGALVRASRAGPRDPDALLERTGGNPFFVEELLRADDDAPVSDGVVDAVDRRARSLGAHTHAVLVVAAVAGSEFDATLVGEVAGLQPVPVLDILDAAVGARLLSDPGDGSGRFAFAHALVREALLRPLTTARRARLHALLGAALEPRARTDPDRYLAALAHHALEAATGGGDPDRAAELAAQAAARAGAVLAHEDAAELMRRAVTMLEQRGVGGARRAQALCALGEALQRAGQPAAAAEPLERAAQLARIAGRPDLLARATLAAGGVGVAVVDVERARIERLETCLELLGHEHEELRARVLARLAIELGYDADPTRREQASRQALALARPGGSPAARAVALSARHVVLWGPDHTAERLELARELIELGYRSGNPELALQGRNWRIADLFEVGDGPAVRAELEGYAALAAEARLPAYSWWVPLWGATLALLEGRIGDGVELSRRARSQALAAGDPNATVVPAQQQLMRTVILEEFDRMDPLALDPRHVAMRRARNRAAWRAYRLTFAWLHAERGEHDAARAALATALDRGVAALPRDANWLASVASATQACAVLADRELARDLRAALTPFADRVVVAARGALHGGSVAYLLARLAATCGDIPAAERYFEDAARRDETSGAPVWVARDLRRHAALRKAHGDDAGARALLQRTIEPPLAPALELAAR